MFTILPRMIEGVTVLVEIVDAKRIDGPSDREIRLQSRDDSYDSLADTHPFEYLQRSLEDETILALQFAITNFYAHCIILKPIFRTMNEYERLRLAHCPRLVLRPKLQTHCFCLKNRGADYLSRLTSGNGCSCGSNDGVLWEKQSHTLVGNQAESGLAFRLDRNDCCFSSLPSASAISNISY
jgi:hypothetical protein